MMGIGRVGTGVVCISIKQTDTKDVQVLVLLASNRSMESLKFQCSLPIWVSRECVLSAAYLINRTPSSSLGNEAPYERLFSKEQTLVILTIGCLVYATTTHIKDKLGPRVIPLVLLGYSKTHKGYILLDIQEKRIFISCDVQFHENIFPLRKNTIISSVCLFLTKIMIQILISLK